MSAIQVLDKTALQPVTRRIRWRRGVFLALDYGLMIGLALFFIFPVVVMVNASFKPEQYVQADMHTLYAFAPRQITLQNYTFPNYQNKANWCTMPGIFELVPFGHILFNSLFVATCGVLAGLLVNSLAAYALARLRWRGRTLALSVIIALIIIPFETLAIPLLLLVNSLPWIDGRTTWIDSYHVQIIPFVADAFSIFLFYQFFIGIPKDFDDAAKVDGANQWMIYWRIIVPLSRPIFATVAILQFLGFWGGFLWPLMVTRGAEFRPLTIAMGVLFTTNPRQWGDIMAYASLVTVPVLIVFLIFQKWFIQSVASSGIKG